MDYELKKLLGHIGKELGHGLKHGFFEYGLFCETVKGRRVVRFKAGRTHQFNIPNEAIPNDLPVTLEMRALTGGTQTEAMAEMATTNAQDERNDEPEDR